MAISDPRDHERVLAYHDATKHRPERYARGPGYLDWATQPNPFRRYVGAERVPLLVGGRTTEPGYEQLFEPGANPPEPVNRKTISLLFECSLGLSAWKAYGGNRWALRCNPSSGNLHPTEGYLLVGPVAGIGDRPAVYHYAPREHELERRHEIEEAAWAALIRPWGDGAFLVGLSSIHWREAWKYGERAFRYCQHDVGHALAGLRLAAATLGWRLRVWDSLSDEEVALLLGLEQPGEDAAEREHPDLIAAVIPADAGAAADVRCDAEIVRAIARGTWWGSANRLSERNVRWEIIDDVAAATRKPATVAGGAARPRENAGEDSRGDACENGFSHERQDSRVGACKNGFSHERITRKREGGCDGVGRVARARPPTCVGGSDKNDSTAARQVFFRRRSGTDYDGVTTIGRDAFYRMLMRLTLGGGGTTPATIVPWDALNGRAHVHLCLFVHLIAGLSPGLYVLVRDESRIDWLRAMMKPNFRWGRPDGCPDELPLFLLQEGDCRRDAAALSLGQDIAGDSAFSLGMLAEFEGPLQQHGPWYYRRLFWEAGMIGQVLYLEAEALAVRSGAAIRGTGIGAYFDDQVHALLSLDGRALQSMYHFTVGGAVDDPRLTTLPPYEREITERNISR